MLPIFANEPEHPLYDLPTEREVDELLRAVGPEEAARRLGELLQERRRAMAKAETDPIQFANRPRLWRIARRLLVPEIVKILVLLGGNRSTKSYCAAYWLLEVALGISARECALNEGVTFLIASESQDSSRATAQKYIWTLLPARLKALNGKRHKDFYIHHSTKEGFSDDIVVLPSGVEMKFVTYNQDPDEWEGRELGLKARRSMAWWADENLPLNWWTMLRRRGQFRSGWGVWSFTPINGITATIREAVASGIVRKTRRAYQLPANQVLVPGLRPGRVPFIQDGANESVRVCYYHSDLTPFRSGGRPYRDIVAEAVRGKTVQYILAVFYGYTEDVAGRAWPKYRRNVHMVRTEDLPWEGSNYLFIDPAGGRSWFLLWVRVPPGSPRRVYIYRDWPDRQRHGEWAIPTVRQIGVDGRKGKDGDRGPAQRNPGWGTARYKAQMLKEETIELTLDASGKFADPDPGRRHTANGAMRDVGLEPAATHIGPSGILECRWTPASVEEFRRLHPDPVRESIRRRFCDPRAAGQPQASAKGGKTLLHFFAEVDRRGDGSIEAPGMTVLPAFSGRDHDEGIRAINDLLDYDDSSPVVPCLNEPHLYVADRCKQVDWVLDHFTGEGEENDGGKDVADLLRYMAVTEDVRFVSGSGLLKTGGFKDGW